MGRARRADAGAEPAVNRQRLSTSRQARLNIYIFCILILIPHYAIHMKHRQMKGGLLLAYPSAKKRRGSFAHLLHSQKQDLRRRSTHLAVDVEYGSLGGKPSNKKSANIRRERISVCAVVRLSTGYTGQGGRCSGPHNQSSLYNTRGRCEVTMPVKMGNNWDSARSQMPRRSRPKPRNDRAARRRDQWDDRWRHRCARRAWNDRTDD